MTRQSDTLPFVLRVPPRLENLTEATRMPKNFFEKNRFPCVSWVKWAGRTTSASDPQSIDGGREVIHAQCYIVYPNHTNRRRRSYRPCPLCITVSPHPHLRTVQPRLGTRPARVQPHLGTLPRLTRTFPLYPSVRGIHNRQLKLRVVLLSIGTTLDAATEL